MIKANELRIGNWVQRIPDKDPFKIIDGEDIDDISDKEGEWDCYEPIELTPEILEKAGFVKIKAEYEEGDYYFKEPRLTFYFEKNNLIRLNRGMNHIKNLHQLQNLYFALTDQELTIEL